MQAQQQSSKIPRQLLTCTICSLIFFKPITLPCGHTFCRKCLRKQVSPKEQKIIEYTEQKIKEKLNTCSICSNIIWKKVSEMHQNRAIQNLVSKFYLKQISDRSAEQTSLNNQMENQNQQNSEYCNKIILRIKQPEHIPLPFGYNQLQFSTAFIDDVFGQSKYIVITWDTIYKKKLGLLCQLMKAQPINNNSTFSQIVYNVQQSQKALQLKYKGTFFGINFVQIQDIGKVSINLRHKLIMLGQEGVDRIMKDLQICNCSVFHSLNHQQVQVQQFNLFFKFYDALNEPHYLKQIRKQIFDGPFQTRNNNESMLYCVLCILKMSKQMKKELIYSFDDKYRIESINNWILSQNQRIQNVFDLKIPGNYHSGAVFLIIFLLFALNLFQNYNKKEEYV